MCNDHEDAAEYGRPVGEVPGAVDRVDHRCKFRFLQASFHPIDNVSDVFLFGCSGRVHRGLDARR